LFRIERFNKVLHESVRKRMSDTSMLADGEWRSKWEGNSEQKTKNRLEKTMKVRDGAS
jgi:hypothetical protein